MFSHACMFLRILVVVFFVQLCAGGPVQTPVIGVLTQDLPNQPGFTYIASSYVKFLESQGARVVPIPHELPHDELTKQFQQLNGVLLPGGSQPILDAANNTFLSAAKHLLTLAETANNNKDVFPIFGTCLGFEVMMLLGANETVITTGFDSENLASSVAFTAAAEESMMGTALGADLMNEMEREKVVANAHSMGLLNSTFYQSPRLVGMYKVLGTEVDRQGQVGVSIVEGRALPFFATQFHPEKAPFEWTSLRDYPHGASAIDVSTKLSRMFVNKARQSTHSYPQPTLMQDAIWNYKPVKTLDVSIFVEAYVFPKPWGRGLADTEQITPALFEGSFPTTKVV